MNIASSVIDLIGRTPLLDASRFAKACELPCRLLCKLEGMNPAGSAKDRVALAMIEAAEACGKLRPGAVIIEPTSGNTGIGLCAVAAVRGYRTVIVMPETMSEERRGLMRAYGAELVLTDGSLGMAGSIARAEELARETEGAFIPSQFENPENPASHERTTGPELWEATDGAIDALVAGIGTGGTVSGVGRYLKRQKRDVHIVGVEPKRSPLLTEGRAGAHGLQGIGANFVPATLDRDVLDEILTVSEEEAYTYGRLFAKKEGILVGISGGAALAAAVRLASRAEWAGRTVAVILPDTGDRYLSTPLYGEASHD